MMSGMPLETCWAFNKLWNNKFYYKVASCWYFYWVTLRCTDPWISKGIMPTIPCRTKKILRTTWKSLVGDQAEIGNGKTKVQKIYNFKLYVRRVKLHTQKIGEGGVLPFYKYLSVFIVSSLLWLSVFLYFFQDF